MAARTEPAPPDAVRDLVITRLFKAPRALVWRAWTEPAMFQQWWGPKDFVAPFARMDVRVGGSYLWCMRHSSGREYWNTGVYREIEPPNRLVCTHALADAQGNRVAPSHYGMPGDEPMESLLTVVLEDAGGGTKLTLRQTGMPASAHEHAGGGWNQALDKLAVCIASEGRRSG